MPKNTVDSGKTSPRRLRMAERRALVWNYRKDRLPIRAIAQQIGCSVSTVHADLLKEIEGLAPIEHREMARQLELARLEELMADWFPKAKEDPIAAGVYLKHSAEYSKLAGLYPEVAGHGRSTTTNNLHVNMPDATKEGIKVVFVAPGKQPEEPPLYHDGSLRPLPKSEHISEAHQGFPRRIEHDPNELPPTPKPAPEPPISSASEQPLPEPTPTGPKARAAALKERFEAEGMNKYSNTNPRGGLFGPRNPNRLWDSRKGTHGGYK